MKNSVKNSIYPDTDLVILAGGQARRMNGLNKLLQKFDDQIQLIKIHQQLKSDVAQVWINSHRDDSIYQKIIPSIHCYQDDEQGFLGPLMGMKSAWSHVQADYVLFVPCDVTYIPPKVILKLHLALAKNSLAEVAYVEMNGTALYPFCLVKRSSLASFTHHLEQKQRSLKHCFADLHAQVAHFTNHALFFHSINSPDELQQHQQIKFLH
ncbi:molybdopterin-guanine dinucleotide biosynthesis protein A [Acinetobacter bohemicus ANC 3994]|jgi:molybdopterin-guanine dinucleotide biosynthesis protein A|uniref:Molybdopterin-guanine dinucleotide biosynthesis protein A n=1 Tax=Acinetobacter bohemicus ANC 3994 TaxID=1217715 RepID=N8P1H3_9GAMM|nr:NTP transferase domain-containing protein [Acinetobacter bohemicus]ENU20260.1 molybdopterin-guanine dinucleotide biosynthesis protein A [Acinetobacter bohemicus ANC 3994]